MVLSRDDAQVVVHGSNLSLTGNQLTGFLPGGNPLDIQVTGNLQNLTLIPEPSTGLLLGLGLIVASRRRR